MVEIITVTPTELRDIIREEVETALSKIDTTPEEMLTYKQACEFLQVSRSVLDSTGMPYSRIGIQRRYLLKDLIDFGRTDRGRAVQEKCKQLRRKV